jgi:hypothetical protein
MRKIRFREIKAAVIKDFENCQDRFNPAEAKSILAMLKRTICTEEIIAVLRGLNFTQAEAYEIILDCISRA